MFVSASRSERFSSAAFRVGLQKAACLVGLAFLFACAGGADSRPSAAPDSRPVGAAHGVDEAIRAVEVLVEREEFRKAREMLAGLRQSPITELDQRRLEFVEDSIKRKMLGRQYLDCFVYLKKTRVILGEPIEGDLVVMNISPQRIRIQAAAASAEEAEAKRPVETESAPTTPKTLLSLKARYREFWPNYMLFESEEFKNIVVDSDVVLESGESRKFPFSIDSLSIHPELSILREYEVSGNLHSADLMIGEEAFQGRLQFRSGAAFVFPRNAEHLGDDPLKRLTSAFEKRAALHLTIVGGWIDATTRERALTLLGDALVDPTVSETMKTAAMATLRVVTGENLAGTAEAWGGYLRSRRPDGR